MIKKIIVLLLALSVFVCLVSCKTVKYEDPDDFNFVEKTGISLSDIKIAYIHSTERTTEANVDELVISLRISSERYMKLDIGELVEYGEVFTELFSKGFNVIFLDEGLSDDFVSIIPIEKQGVYFISFKNELTASKNVINFDEDFLDYAFFLGVIAAQNHNGSNLGILTDNLEDYVHFNAFAAGVTLVNSNVKVIVSKKLNILEQNGCEGIFVPYSYKNTQIKTDKTLYGFGNTSENRVFLNPDYTDYFKKCITRISEGSFLGDKIQPGASQGICDASLENLEISAEIKTQIKDIQGYFEQGLRIFSQNHLMKNGDNLIFVTEPIVDNKGNTVIDVNGNYYFYENDELAACNSYQELIDGKMNYYYGNIEIR